MNWQFESMNGFMGGGMWLFWLILLVVMFVLIKLFVSPKDSESAMDILKKRYANGEITNEQFEEQKKNLQSQ